MRSSLRRLRRRSNKEGVVKLVDEAKILELLGQVGDELSKKFSKKYSSSRLEQIKSHLATLRMLVEHIHDEADREEEPARKDAASQQMVLAGVPMSEAKNAVERGER